MFYERIIIRVLLIRKIARFLVPALLVITFCCLANNIVNQHIHTLSSGIVIKHAHPVKHGNIGNPWKDHKHTPSQLIILDHLFNIIFLICLSFVFIFLVHKELREYKISCFSTPKKRYLYYLLNYHAPPSCSY